MMSDVDRAIVADEDRLPWLEPVGEDEPRGSGGAGTGTLVAALIAALVALGLVVGGVFWLRDRGRNADGAGEGELIAAPAGEYKQKPSSPGGMKVEGQGDAAYAASTGADVNSAIDIAAVPEAPVKGAGSTKAERKPAPAPEPKPIKPAVAVAAGKTVAGGTIQLGAFSSQAKANEAWKSLSGRFAYLKPYSGGVTPVSIGKGTMYRLRAGVGGEAQTICGKLKVAGETCAVVSN